MMNKETKNSKSGFTLVETLVAVSVLIVSISGPLSIAAQGLFTARIARDQLTAVYLAQEAVEFVRNTRDNNVLGGGNWLLGLGGVCGGNGCTVDSVSKVINSCSSTCPVLRYNSSNGFYGYSTASDWKDSIYTRKITVEDIGGAPNREAEVVVEVSWQTGPRQRSFIVRESILNWQ